MTTSASTSTLRRTLLSLAPVLLLCAFGAMRPDAAPLGPDDAAAAPPSTQPSKDARAMSVHYLEIVTPELDATCAALEAMHGVRFGAPVVELGQARTATIAGGGRLAVRKPMRETEQPVVRPYLLVDDIGAAVNAAREAGAQIAMMPTELPGQGTFAIYVLGGIQHGLWER